MNTNGIGRLLSVLVAVSAALFMSFPLRAANAAPVLCQHAGTVQPKPGLTTTSTDLAFAFAGDVECHKPDGTSMYGTESGGGRATGSCAQRTATGQWKIRWRNGGTTVMSVEFLGVGNVILTRGTVKKGPLAGQTMTDAHMLSGFNPLDCMSGNGVTKAAYQGALTIASST